MFKKCFSCLLPSRCFQESSSHSSLTPGFYAGRVISVLPKSLSVVLSPAHSPETSIEAEVARPDGVHPKSGETVFILKQEGREIVTVPEAIKQTKTDCKILCLRSTFVVLADELNDSVYVFPFQYVYPPTPAALPQTATLVRLTTAPHYQIVLPVPQPPTQVLTAPIHPQHNPTHTQPLPSALATRENCTFTATLAARSNSRMSETREGSQYRSFVTVDEGDGVAITSLALPDCDSPRQEDDPLRKPSPWTSEARSFASLGRDRQPLTELCLFGATTEEVAQASQYAVSWRYCGEGRNSLFVCALIWWLESIARCSDFETELQKCRQMVADCAQEDIQSALASVAKVLDEVETARREAGEIEAFQVVQSALRQGDVLAALHLCARNIFYSQLDHSDALIETLQSATSVPEDHSIKYDADYSLVSKATNATIAFLDAQQFSGEELLLYQQDGSYRLLYQKTM